jgi:multidrug efflux pump subunit AcrB
MFIVPLTVMLVVPISLGGVLPLLYLIGTALNVQSLLGIIFVVGIKVANTVLMTDLAQEPRRHKGLLRSGKLAKMRLFCPNYPQKAPFLHGNLTIHRYGWHRI